MSTLAQIKENMEAEATKKKKEAWKAKKKNHLFENLDTNSQPNPSNPQSEYKRKQSLYNEEYLLTNNMNLTNQKKFKDFSEHSQEQGGEPHPNMASGSVQSSSSGTMVTTSILYSKGLNFTVLRTIHTFWINTHITQVFYDHLPRRLISKYPNVSYFWQFFTSLAWNYKGLGTRDVKKYLNDMLNKLNPDIVFLSETKQNSGKFEKFMHDLGVTNFWYVNPGGASGTAGGLALIWKNCINSEIKDYSINHINAIIKNGNTPLWLFTGYYGNPYDTLSKLLSWNMHSNTAASYNLPWLILGDFNFILHDSEKFSTHPMDINEANIYKEKILELDLIDISFTGCPFTWSNKRKGHALTEQR